MLIENLPIDFNKLQDVLNPSAFSFDSVQGIIILFFIGYIIMNVTRKAFKLMWFAIAVICAMQIFWILGGTELAAYIPFRSVIKYDVFSSLAQLCVGTKLSEFILWLGAILDRTFSSLVGFIFSGGRDGLRAWVPVYDDIMDFLPHGTYNIFN